MIWSLELQRLTSALTNSLSRQEKSMVLVLARIPLFYISSLFTSEITSFSIKNLAGIER